MEFTVASGEVAAATVPAVGDTEDILQTKAPHGPAVFIGLDAVASNPVVGGHDRGAQEGVGTCRHVIPRLIALIVVWGTPYAFPIDSCDGG